MELTKTKEKEIQIVQKVSTSRIKATESRLLTTTQWFYWGLDHISFGHTILDYQKTTYLTCEQCREASTTERLVLDGHQISLNIGYPTYFAYHSKGRTTPGGHCYHLDAEFGKYTDRNGIVYENLVVEKMVDILINQII